MGITAVQVSPSDVDPLGAILKKIDEDKSSGSDEKINQISLIIRKALKNAPKSIEIAVSDIKKFAGQPRKFFDEEALGRLSHEIATVGQIQSIYVRESRNNSSQAKYELIDGERRWMVIGKMGIPIRAIVLDLTDDAVQYLFSVAVNFGAEKHTDIEIATAMHNFVNKIGLSVSAASKIHGIDAQLGYQYLSLLKLPQPVRDLMCPSLGDSQLKKSTALRLVQLPEETQIILAQKISVEQLSLVSVQKLIRKYSFENGIEVKRGKRKRNASDDVALMEDRLKTFPNKLQEFIELLETGGKESVTQSEDDIKARLLSKLLEAREKVNDQFEIIEKIIKNNE